MALTGCLTAFIFSTIFCSALASKYHQCPRRLITERQSIESPLYPQYPSHFRCWYNITAPEGYVVEVNFENFQFPAMKTYNKMNYGRIDDECVVDYLQWWDDEAEGNGLKFCGMELNQKIFASKRRSMKLLFQSFSAMEQGGFKAMITFRNKSEEPSPLNVIVENGKQIPALIDGLMALSAKAPIGKVPTLTVNKNGGEMCGVATVPAYYSVFDKDDSQTMKCNGEQVLRYFQKNINFLEVDFSPIPGNEDAVAKISFVDPILTCNQEFTEQVAGKSFQLTTPLLPGFHSCLWTIPLGDASKVTLSFGNSVLDNKNSRNLCLSDSLVAFVKSKFDAEEAQPALCGSLAGRQIEFTRPEAGPFEVVVMLFTRNNVNENKQFTLRYELN